MISSLIRALLQNQCSCWFGCLYRVFQSLNLLSFHIQFFTLKLIYLSILIYLMSLVRVSIQLMLLLTVVTYVLYLLPVFPHFSRFRYKQKHGSRACQFCDKWKADWNGLDEKHSNLWINSAWSKVHAIIAFKCFKENCEEPCSFYWSAFLLCFHI